MAASEIFPPFDLQDALAQSAVRGSFIDTAYHIFSHRLLSGKVGKPRVIYGNSLVMKAAGQHFRELSASFSKTHETPEEVEADEYGYQSDSDLDDDWDLEEVRSPTSPSSSRDKGKSKSEDSDELSKKAEPPKANEAVEHTVVITDVAANTWEALLFYIYTGKINFAPLRSQGAEGRMQAMKQHKYDHPHRPPLCSPKSVYRLADKVGLEALKVRASSDLRTKLHSTMILDEVFSKFSSRYCDIMSMQVDYLCDHGLSRPAVAIGLQQKIRSVVEGELPHATNILMSLLQKITPNPSPLLSPPPPAADNGVMSPSCDYSRPATPDAPHDYKRINTPEGDPVPTSAFGERKKAGKGARYKP
ncbi:unnamed protein product [Somion occarium]|uniref:BTB domain-containing protein n=1 Tax=Somion occarium TaxID=3059160 RepID=A0ABP1E3K3_9APHY